MATDLTALISQLTELCSQLQTAMEPSVVEDTVLAPHTAGWTKEDALLAMHCIACMPSHQIESNPSSITRIVRHLHKSFQLTAEDIFPTYHLFHKSVITMNLPLLSYLVEEVGVPRDVYDVERKNLVNSCLGNTDVLMYLHDKFGVTKPDFDLAFVVPVVKAQLKQRKGAMVKDTILHTLHTTFRMTGKDLLSIILDVFRVGISGAHMEFVKDFEKTFGYHMFDKTLTEAFKRASDYSIEELDYLRKHCGLVVGIIKPSRVRKNMTQHVIQRDVERIKWWRRIGLTKEAVMEIPGLIARICHSGDVRIMECLRTDYGFTPQDFVDCRAHVHCSFNGQLNLVKYLWEEVGLKSDFSQPKIFAFASEAFFVAATFDAQAYLLGIIRGGGVDGPVPDVWRLVKALPSE